MWRKLSTWHREIVFCDAFNNLIGVVMSGQSGDQGRKGKILLQFLDLIVYVFNGNPRGSSLIVEVVSRGSCNGHSRVSVNKIYRNLRAADMVEYVQCTLGHRQHC